MSYYGENDYRGDDSNPQKMAIEACQQLDATVDFSEYDRDNDGYIDNVYIFYAGRGEASGGSSSTVWPHSWEVSAVESQTYYFDNVILNRYACGNEWEGDKPDGVGTFIHEFSHVLGLPDLYSTSYSSAFTPGSWSAMDYGPYNNNGCTPPLYSVFEICSRLDNSYRIGWTKFYYTQGYQQQQRLHNQNQQVKRVLPAGKQTTERMGCLYTWAWHAGMAY